MAKKKTQAKATQSGAKASKKKTSKQAAAKKKTATKKTAKKKTAAKKTAAKKTAAKKTAKKSAAEEAPESSEGAEAAAAEPAAKKAATKKTAKKKTATKKTAKKKTATKKTAKKKAAAEEAEPEAVADESAAPAKAPAKKKAKKAKKGAEAPAPGSQGVDQDKLAAVLGVILPESSSDRAAKAAAASVWAISSEKTQDVRAAIRESDAAAEDEAREELVEVAPGDPVEVDVSKRRCSRDPYGFFREELLRDELEPSDLVAGWRHTNQRLRHELLPGLSDDALCEVERAWGHALPPSYRDFALEWSGGELFTRPEGGYRVLSPEQMLREIDDRLGGLMRLPYYPVVDLGCADYLCLDLSKTSSAGEHPIHWWSCGEPQRRVAENFARWLRNLVEARGEPYWWSAGVR